MPEQSFNAGPLAKHSLSASELKELLGVERRGEAFVAFRDGEQVLRFFTFGSGERTVATIGRRAEADLPLRWDGEVSGLHLELHRVGGELTIVDDGLSTNGTYVNGKRISARQRLRDGDLIRVGRTMLEYRAAQATLVDETVAASEQAVVRLTDMQRQVLIALCRPYRDGAYATPATNREIAGELFLSVDAVKLHLRAMFAKFGLGELAQNQKRAALAEQALRSGTITHRDLEK
jgi:DNA-binding CsgD family transcriptional regulator